MFQKISLNNGERTITGELVVETALDYQVAADGAVKVYPKAEWHIWSDFSRILDAFGGLR